MAFWFLSIWECVGFKAETILLVKVSLFLMLGHSANLSIKGKEFDQISLIVLFLYFRIKVLRKENFMFIGFVFYIPEL